MEIITIKSGSKVLAQFEIKSYSEKASVIFGNAIGEVYPLLQSLLPTSSRKYLSLNNTLKYQDGNSPVGTSQGIIFPNFLCGKAILALSSPTIAKFFKEDNTDRSFQSTPVRRYDLSLSQDEKKRLEELEERLQSDNYPTQEII